VEDLSQLPSQEQLDAFPELSRDQIDTLLKVPHWFITWTQWQ